MQIKIEVDVRPDELRRFVGLPDVAGLQDDVIHFVREKLAQASDSFDASAFVKSNLKYLSRNPLVMRLLAAARPKSADDLSAGETSAEAAAEVSPSSAEAPAAAAPKPKARRAGRKGRGARTAAKATRKRTSRSAAG